MTLLNRALLRSRAALPPGVSGGVLQDLPERILQFGEGNFLRAFADWMVDVVNERGLGGGHVVVVQPIPQGMVGQLDAQDGLYTLISRGIEGGKVVQSRRIVTSISRALNPYTDWASVAALVRSGDLRLVISNTTEAGIAYVPEPWTPETCPQSFPAKVAALLYERFLATGGNPARGLIFLPCELIEGNGAALRQCVLEHTRCWHLPADFSRWVESANCFLNTLVDRIVTGFPHHEADRLTEELGYEDRLLDAAEWFHLWVIEGPSRLAGALPFHKAGLNVIWTDDLRPYRVRKVRILNGAHTAGALAAFLGGVNTVREMMEDELFGRFVRRAVFDEIVPTLAGEEDSQRDYAAAVLERFRNPFVEHQLLSILLNSVSKWKVRVLPSLLDWLNSRGKLPPALAFSLAALIRFYDGAAAPRAQRRGTRNGQCYPICDEADVLDVFGRAWDNFHGCGDVHGLVHSLLSQAPLWKMDLTQVPGLADAIEQWLQTILTSGVRPAVAALLARG